MSRWEYSLDKPMSYDEYFFVPRYPRHVARAFIAVNYDDREEIAEEEIMTPYQKWIEEAIQSFAKRWGGLDDAVFVRALQEAKGRDRLAAIFAIGHHSGLAQALDLLAPFLASANQLERCAAACMFTLRRDERALPVLEEYFLQEAPEDERGRFLPESEVWYASYRSRIAYVASTWGPPSLGAVLRKAFVHLWELEEHRGANTYDQDTQDALCYALGRRGALGAFHGVALPAQRRRLAMMYLALGYVQANERYEQLYHEVLLNKELQQELAGVLAELFVLSGEESAETVDAFADDIYERRHAMYGLDKEEEQAEENEPEEER